jgi:putative oxidoreductase
MDISLIAVGADAPGAALTLNRVALGTFFAISGYHKLFNASRHATLVRTLQDTGVPALPIMQWLVPGVEFSAGCALIIGLLSALAAFGLFAVTFIAIALDGIKRIPAWMPINRADWLGDFLYLPESLYCLGLAVLMLGGPGPWSLDAVIVTLLARQGLVS